MVIPIPRGSFLAVLSLMVHLLGCSHRLWLHDPGNIVLARQGRSIEIMPKHLVIKWLADGVVYSTQAQADGEDVPVGVHIARADEQYVYVKAEDWKSLEDIPRNYLKLKEVRVVARKKGRNPVVAIPLRQIREIGIYEAVKPPVLSRFSKKDVVIGALGGVAVILGGSVSASIPPDSGRDNEILAAFAIGASVGAIVYPAYKVLNPQCEQDLTASYLVDEQEGWKIEIRRE